ncbi:MAG: CbiX/SirB N-terminal domain-containing protein [Actinomycetota bacterium]|nr:CbiX/SirB N-terminal domain-containing protein [Actinomycetota bacterium]
MEFLAEAVRSTGRYLAVRTAIAERGLTSLPEGLEACAQAGARKITVIPVFFGRDRSLIHWLSKSAYRWSRARGEPVREVVFAGAIEEHPALGEAVVRAVADAEGASSVRADNFQNLEDPPPGP